MILKFLWIGICLIQISKESCSSNKYPVGLKANSLEVKYMSIETHSSGNIILGGSSNNNVFFPTGTISPTNPYGFPIFQFYDVSTCNF